MLDFPARFFVRFLHNHGMLSVNDRPHVARHPRRFGALRREAGCAVPGPHPARIRRWSRSGGMPGRVIVKARGRRGRALRRCVHRLPQRPGAARCSPTRARPSGRCSARFPIRSTRRCCTPMHALLPQRAAAHGRPGTTTCCPGQARPVALTYNMNILQRLDAPEPFCVTLNHGDAIDPARNHQARSPITIRSTHRRRSPRRRAITKSTGVNRTYYCGACWRNGFHEDGVVSALAALEHFREAPCTAPCTRVA